MGKAQKKTGKGRLDKYYKLAKEQGYRARSAFKLIQLNKKYSFLETARCTIDLCAAPGGWLQVASKYMPVNSIIVGVDLVPIKPIPRVTTFTADITTPQCRNLIRSEVKDWKADVVLHDGAPNVGTAWVQDAYSQSELVLMSLKLAVEFLAKGGTFVTKVFRSVDYNNLIWVFSQLFGKVEATKPPSSRNVSAEIFVVCRDFLAPKLIDSKFLDPKHVFKELSASASAADKGISANNTHANVFQPEKKRRKRDGYEEGDYTLFKKAEADEFIRCADPVALLGSVSKIAFETQEEKEWLNFEGTTSEIRANCEDLKVLGKGDFKALIRWRAALREELGLDVKTKEAEELTEVVEVIEEVDEEEQIQQEFDRIQAETAARSKRAKRRANELRQRAIQRMQLQMTAPLDIGLEQSDPTLSLGQEDMFELADTEKHLRKKGGELIDLSSPDVSEEEGADKESVYDGEVLDEEEERARKVSGLETELDGLYDAYQERLKERDAKYKVKQERKKNKEREEEWGGIKDGKDSDEDEESDSEGGWDEMAEAKADMGCDSDDDESEDEEEEAMAPARKRQRLEGGAIATDRGQKRRKPVTDLEGFKTSRNAQLWFSRDVFAGVDDLDDLEDDERLRSSEGEDVMEADGDAPDDDMQSVSILDNPDLFFQDDDFEVVPQEQDDVTWDVVEDAARQKMIQEHGLLTAEAMTLAQQLVNRQKTKSDLINDGFSRYSLNAKDGLPSWFLDDEAKHYKANIPITKEAVDALRAKMRALDARPIKKVAEAKARKKMKAAQKLTKAMKKAEGVNQTVDMTEREKAQQIEKLMKKGMSTNKKKKEVKVVVAKGAHKGIKGRPKGVKGRYTMVDSRMKKEASLSCS
ncbi:FtsJ-domain-containing protein [Neolentinus lepideus HHB14362 ss-1]|uniref:FtsJ-domain-containing protein n=1 Tax=Neolentinus lepideus HHB14362 ss-1 TaxID=1314782 RepID=A0A165W0H1_9AGAM|nr:FtsJ-domain-containing protein [Neolentinus lepideus HHB14362 ss-1]